MRWRASGSRSNAPTDSSVDLRQHAQAATCEYGYLRVVTRTITRTKSLHRRRTRFPLKVSGRGWRFCPGPTFLCHWIGIDRRRRRSWVGLSACSPQVVWPMLASTLWVPEPGASNFVVTDVGVPRGGGYGGDPLSPRGRPRERVAGAWRIRLIFARAAANPQ
jgi:hypothetical protein